MSASSMTVVRATSACAAAIRCDIARRMPRKGSAGPTSATLLAARSTSSRVIVPPGPVACTRLRSTSSLRASARTAGRTWRVRAGAGSITVSAAGAAFSSRSSSPTTVPVSSCAPSANSTSGAPTLTRSPLPPNSRAMRPRCGEGTSTTALSVSTETSGWSTTTRSPSLTCQVTISASSRPSPRSGSRNCRMADSLSAELTHFAGRGHDAADRRHVMLLEPRQRDDGVIAGDTDYRSEQRGKSPLRDERGDFSTEAAGARRFVDDDAASGLRHRSEHGLLVIGLEGGKVDDLRIDVLAGELLGGRERLFHHRTPADQSDGPAFAQDESDVERQGLAVILDLSL